MFRFSAREIALIGLGIALIAICSWISIPMTVPFTLQTFAVCLVTALLGLKGVMGRGGLYPAGRPGGAGLPVRGAVPGFCWAPPAAILWGSS